jgi:hypothetical protein
MPLDKVGEMADAQIEKMKAPAPAPQKAQESPQMPPVDFQPQFIELGRAIREAATESRQRLETAIGELAGSIEEMQSAPEPVVDVKAAEALAVREAELARIHADISENLLKERETTDKVLVLSLKRSIDNLAVWEWKALEKAIDKPLEWADWRVKFYQRFSRQFESDLGEFVADAEACGISLDLAWGADRYAGDSIRDLKTLDEAARDNFHDRIKECCDHFRKRQWMERSKELAAELVLRGRKLFSEREAKQ